MMRSLFKRVLFAATLFCIASVSPARTPASALDATSLAEAALGELPGVTAVGILRGDKLEVAVRRRERAGAPMVAVDPQAGPEPLFEIGSVSKVFTGLLVAQAVERGELSLNDTLGTLLAGRVQFRWEQAAKLTVRQLLTHTSCLPRWPTTGSREPQAKQLAEYDRARLWSGLGDMLLTRVPPCETKYSNLGFAILGELLAERAGTSWDALVHESITRPTGMASTALLLPRDLDARLAPSFSGAVRAARWDMQAFAPAGGLRSTATDMLLFSRALLAGSTGPMGPAAERATTGLADYGERSARIGYGVILPASPARVWAHMGMTGGYRAEWIAWPDSGEAVVMLVSNSASPSHDIARKLVQQTWIPQGSEPAYTRGELRSISEQDGGRRYAHIKLAPGRKMPFSTLTYRVLDSGLLAGLKPGSAVEFRAERRNGENVVTAIRPASSCAASGGC